jgi:PTH1 family peptidyl-tRNA hydrolase
MRDEVVPFWVIGLGNPGRKYQGTRHNIGFRFVDQMASFMKASFKEEKGCLSEVAVGSLAEVEVHLVKPKTYVNLSGQALEICRRDIHFSLRSLCVVADDVNIPFGVLRLRKEGGTGGHNGLKSIQETLQTQDYPRLRIGVGRPSDEHGGLADYVLAPFSEEEQGLLPQILGRGIQAITVWLQRGIHHAMDLINPSPPNPSKEV